MKINFVTRDGYVLATGKCSIKNKAIKNCEVHVIQTGVAEHAIVTDGVSRFLPLTVGVPVKQTWKQRHYPRLYPTPQYDIAISNACIHTDDTVWISRIDLSGLLTDD